MGENKFKFQKLTPIKNVDMSLYGEALDFIFDNPDVHNVAITGAYGAGKSSMLQTYKENKKHIRFLHISLAHFEQNNNEEDYEIKEVTIEGKILNQLIHQIPVEKIPQSNFRVKRKVENKSIVLSLMIMLVFLLSALHIINFEKWSSYVNNLSESIIKSVLRLASDPYAMLVSGLLCGISACTFLWGVIRAQKHKSALRKISLQGNEIEIFEENKDSFFDKYLNEVLYLFENTGSDVIVFEDMDRFDTNGIFERLREINTLANIQLSKDGKPPLRFFYLLRDDIFISKDRTKFFDYIVPVMPVVDSSNSYNQFIAHFKEGGIFELFNEGFLQGLSLYVDDMRILKNIYNEFIVYYNRLNTTELDCNKMLGIITYKNIFPRDFSDLQLNRGFVYTLFANKESIIDKEVKRIKSEIDIKKEEIKLARKEHLSSQGELEIIFNARRGTDYYGNLHPLKSKDQAEYDKRILAIETNVNGRCHEIEADLSDLEDQATQIRNRSIKDVITRENIDEIFRLSSTNEIGQKNDFQEIKGSEYFSLLKYLIRNGHIDETYADYMTYFYENSLSRGDKVFLRSITDRKAKAFDYQLKKLSLIVSRLRLSDFEQEEILNFNLLEYLLQTPERKNFADRFIKQLKDTKNFQFIESYLDIDKALTQYVKMLNSCWPGLFSYALSKNSMSSKQLRHYSISSLCYSSLEDIQQMNEDGRLTKYISESADYLNISEPMVKRLISGFKALGISFIDIDPSSANEALFKAVYENSLYQINFKNITLMLNTFYASENESDICHQNYTLVLSQPNSPLSKYINDNIGIYIDIVLQNSNGRITDSESVSLTILNNGSITNEQKENYIEQLVTTITSLSTVRDKGLWGILLLNEAVAYSMETVAEYFGDSATLDSILANFINGNKEPLDFSKTEDQYGEEKAQKLFEAMIICDKLSDIKYREILPTFDYNHKKFSIKGLSDTKFKIIIDTKIAQMTPESLVFIRKHYPTHCLYFIASDVSQYADLMTDNLFLLNEIEAILNWDISDSLKIKLLGFTDEPISVIGLKCSYAITSHILNENLDLDDLPELFASYDGWTDEIKQIILRLAIENISEIITSVDSVSSALLKNLFASSLNTDQKVDVFASSLPKFKLDECEKIFDLLKLPPEYKKISDRSKRPSFEANDTNQKLLFALS